MHSAHILKHRTSCKACTTEGLKVVSLKRGYEGHSQDSSLDVSYTKLDRDGRNKSPHQRYNVGQLPEGTVQLGAVTYGYLYTITW